MKELLLSQPAFSLYTIGIVVNALLGGVAFMTWVERRLSGMIQYRLGPNRVGPMGLFQPVADGVKFFWKEDVIPRDAFRPIFVLAPILAMVTALCAFSVVPFGPTIELLGRKIPLVIVNVQRSFDSLLQLFRILSQSGRCRRLTIAPATQRQFRYFWFDLAPSSSIVQARLCTRSSVG